MQDIKSLLFTELEELIPTLSNVNTVKSFITTERALGDVEKIVFKDASIALGDYSFENIVFAVGWDKITTKVQILYFIKSNQAVIDSVNNIDLISADLRHNAFGTDSLIKGELNVSYEFIQLTDKIFYTILEYSIIEIQRRT